VGTSAVTLRVIPLPRRHSQRISDGGHERNSYLGEDRHLLTPGSFARFDSRIAHAFCNTSRSSVCPAYRSREHPRRCARRMSHELGSHGLAGAADPTAIKTAVTVAFCSTAQRSGTSQPEG
jgi:hypothetical protein